MIELAAAIMATTLLGSDDDLKIFRDNGWYAAGVERSSFRECPEEIKLPYAKEAVEKYYSRDSIHKKYNKIRINEIVCSKQSRVIRVTSSVSGVLDIELVFLLNDKFEVIGKFLDSPYGRKSW